MMPFKCFTNKESKNKSIVSFNMDLKNGSHKIDMTQYLPWFNYAILTVQTILQNIVQESCIKRRQIMKGLTIHLLVQHTSCTEQSAILFFFSFINI